MSGHLAKPLKAEMLSVLTAIVMDARLPGAGDLPQLDASVRFFSYFGDGPRV